MTNKILCRDRKNFDLKQYQTQIGQIDWSDLYRSDNIDVINNIFEENLRAILDRMAPIKVTQQRRKFRSWVSQETKLEMMKRDSLRQAAKSSGRMEDWAKYCVQRNLCVKLLSRSKSDHFKELYSKIEKEHDTRNLYRLTYEILDKKVGNTPQQFVTDGKLERKPRNMAILQMKYYTQNIRKLVSTIPTSNRNPHRFLDTAMESWTGKYQVPFFEFKDISVKETLDIISSMPNSTALGHAKLDTLGIKNAQSQLVHPIRHIINLSLRNGKFARKWKFAQITPSLKSPDLDKFLVSLYRPIAILPPMSKLVEQACQIQLLNFP